MAATPRSLAAAIYHLPNLHRRLNDVERRLIELSKQITIAAVQAEEAAVLARRTHSTLEALDPQQCYEIVVAVRDDVARLSIEVTDELNRFSAALTEPDPSQG